MVSEPESAFAPDQPPLAWQLFAFVLCHESCVPPPAVTDDGLALNCKVGAGEVGAGEVDTGGDGVLAGEAGAAVGSLLDPPHPDSTSAPSHRPATGRRIR
jgi:hypothetical protein